MKVYVLKKGNNHGGVQNLEVYQTEEEALREGERVVRHDAQYRADFYAVEVWDIGDPAYTKWKPDCVWVDDRPYVETNEKTA